MVSTLNPASISGGIIVSVIAEAASYNEDIPESFRLKGGTTHGSNGCRLDTILLTFTCKGFGETNKAHLSCRVVGLAHVS